MHYQVQFAVRLNDSVTIDDVEGESITATHYVSVFGVNAHDVADAVSLAQAEWQSADDEDADGDIESAEVEVIDDDDLDEEVLSEDGDPSQRGVFFSSGRMYFDEDEVDLEDDDDDDDESNRLF